MEVLLVLALIGAVAVMAWPAMQRPLSNRRLRTAADDVRTEWSQARNEAMRSGQTHAFRCAPEGRRYCSGPGDGQTESLPTNDDRSSLGDSAADAPLDEPPPLDGQRILPGGVHFVTVEVTEDSAEGEAEPLPPDAAGWSEPIFFYPDGTTSDARLTIANDQGNSMELKLRGLTGTVTVGDIGAAQERK
jgi:hypothetical protein